MRKLKSNFSFPLVTFRKIFSALFILFLLIQCKKDGIISPDVPKNLPNKENDTVSENKITEPVISYSLFLFPKNQKDSAMADFNEKFSTEEQKVILALSRLDLKNKWRSDTLVIPDRIDPTLMIYSPFPGNVKILSSVNKMVLFSYPIQAYALYEKGKLIKWGPTSMGKKTAQTKRGLMFANWKKELAISTVNKSWKLPYNFNVHNTLGIGWHQFDLPGFPASHSCLRLLEDDAIFMYKWADQWTLTENSSQIKSNGTPVIVFGDYLWGGKKPWFNLSNNPQSNAITEDQLNEIIEPSLYKILEEQDKTETSKADREAKKNDVSEF